MARQIFVNLPVADLQASIAFFARLGFHFNPEYTDDTATCMIIGDNIFAMLLTRERFAEFTPLPVSDARAATEVLVALTLESREAVDTMVRKAAAAGGSIYNDPQDHGFMYGHGFQDLDGHIWELVHMTGPPSSTP
ncbi:MAG: VOC family protein [Nitrococcus mobilis]|nr:VOC family protein [Nitrococcus mobilis]